MAKGPKPRPVDERFWSHVDRRGPDECWLWTGYVQPNGYGKFKPTDNSSSIWVHRMAYMLEVGPIPEGLTLDHLCKMPRCCNPAHLEPVTLRENLLRSDSASGRNARKTHCPKGHPLEGDNVIVRKTKTGIGRECRACENARQRERYEADREARKATMRAYYQAKKRGTSDP